MIAVHAQFYHNDQTRSPFKEQRARSMHVLQKHLNTAGHREVHKQAMGLVLSTLPGRIENKARHMAAMAVIHANLPGRARGCHIDGKASPAAQARGRIGREGKRGRVQHGESP